VGLSWGWEDDGLRQYLLRLDPEAAAELESALGPLAAPPPSAVEEPDPRGSDRRRAEALIEIVRRGVKSAGGQPVTDKATLVVTMDFDALRARAGAGVALGGQFLGPDTIRRIACDARVIPVVVGTQGEVLDMGRTTRLAPPRMLTALLLRDRGCTFPGCSRPPTWCDTHHVTHWADGGSTDMDNMALVCARHHTIVHQRGLTATGVTWHA
jgi:hypothetical protein